MLYSDQEDPLEKEMATHSSILACRIPMDRGAWWATVHGVANSQTRLSDFTFFSLMPLSLSLTCLQPRLKQTMTEAPRCPMYLPF